MSTVGVKGLSELQAFLSSLPAKVEKNIMRSALRQGANVLKDEAKKNLSANGNIDTGKLRDGIRVSTNYKRGVVSATVKAKGTHGYIGHWIEYGVAAHSLKKGAKRKSGKYQDQGRKHHGITPHPFMRPALDTKAQQALLAVGNQIKAKLTEVGINTKDIDLTIEL